MKRESIALFWGITEFTQNTLSLISLISSLLSIYLSLFLCSFFCVCRILQQSSVINRTSDGNHQLVSEPVIEMADGVTTRLQKEVTQLQKDLEKLEVRLEAKLDKMGEKLGEKLQHDLQHGIQQGLAGISADLNNMIR